MCGDDDFRGLLDAQLYDFFPHQPSVSWTDLKQVKGASLIYQMKVVHCRHFLTVCRFLNVYATEAVTDLLSCR